MLLDTSAWIELFKGGKDTAEIKKILISENCYTSIVTLAEITNWAEKEGKNYQEMVDGVNKLSTIIELDQSIAIVAGRLNFERKKVDKKWGMLDSFILATGLSYNLKILTKDSDFKDLSSARVLWLSALSGKNAQSKIYK